MSPSKGRTAARIPNLRGSTAPAGDLPPLGRVAVGATVLAEKMVEGRRRR
ncbi:hypothetical protein [Streptomyces collinus]|nr:hypothetical protein [Streptomyces collinus]